ncbi:MAG: hypothetical protein M3R36_11855 [Bacteroidota bacterium]|nr:hypothetical protein [Bacteroidota bacterium]
MKYKSNLKLLLITILFSSITLSTKKINAQAPPWIQTSGPYAGVSTAMVTVGDNIFTGNLYWGRGDGRVYRTTNFGTDWFAAENGLPFRPYIYDFDNVGNTIFAAEGGQGVHRTTDFGVTWVKKNSGLVGTTLSLLSKDSLIFVGLSGPGVYVSTNLGESWTARNNGLPGVVIPYEFAKMGNYIYVGLEGGGGPAPLYRSSNDGLQWEIINNGLPLGSNVHEFAVNGNTIFASIQGDFGAPEYGLFRSTDFGNSWVAVNNGIPYIVGGNTRELFAHNGVVYVSTLLSQAAVRLYKSTNNGDSWIPLVSGIRPQPTYSFTAEGNYVYAGMGYYSSVFRSSNNGDSWEEARKGLANSSAFKLMEKEGRIYCGAQEGLFYTDDNGVNWTEVQNGLPFGSPVWALEKNGPNIYAGMDQYGVYRSTNNGLNWSEINSGFTGIYSDYVEDLLVVDNVLYAGTWDGVFKTTNNGDNWFGVNTGLTAQGGGNVRVNTLAASGNNLFVGTSLNRVFKSTNGGDSWFASGNGIATAGSTIYELFVKGNEIFAATEGGIYRSTNEGSSWTLTSPAGIVHKITGTGNVLFASAYAYTILSGQNVIISTDNGATWVAFSEGLSYRSAVTSLLIKDGFLYGTTDTRSVWKRQISSLLPTKTLSLKLFIQGFYNPLTNQMIKDTARIYLRSISSPYSVVDSARAVLDSTGMGNFTFSNAVNSVPYYIVIRHRNGLETWSAAGQSFTSGNLIYDFTLSASMAYGNNQILEGTKYCIYNGDVNQDETIDLSDGGLIDNDAFNFVSGYVSTDVNGDGVIDLSDLEIVDNNINNFISIIRP